eukprot:scaffold41884_cov58-Phaeocystis_antarctica.AAC.4
MRWKRIGGVSGSAHVSHEWPSCAPRVFRASQGPRRPCSTPPGGARQGPIAGYVLQSAQRCGRWPGRVPGLTGAYHHRQYTAPLCLGVRGPA